MKRIIAPMVAIAMFAGMGYAGGDDAPKAEKTPWAPEWRHHSVDTLGAFTTLALLTLKDNSWKFDKGLVDALKGRFSNVPKTATTLGLMAGTWFALELLQNKIARSGWKVYPHTWEDTKALVSGENKAATWKTLGKSFVVPYGKAPKPPKEKDPVDPPKEKDVPKPEAEQKDTAAPAPAPATEESSK
ncbi:hypothetical protein HOD08_02055 [bacterium]|nr:hypothetical protein [bacterium]